MPFGYIGAITKASRLVSDGGDRDTRWAGKGGKMGKAAMGTQGMWWAVCALTLMGCPDDEVVYKDVDVEVVEVDTEDVAPEVDTVAPDRHRLDLTLDPPGVSSLSGWVVVNRFGRWLTDSSGQVTIEVSRVGLTLSLILPPGVAGEDARVPSVLVLPTVYLEEETPPATAKVGVREGAAGLLLLDPRMLSEDPFLMRKVLSRAATSPAVARLAGVIDARFDVLGIRVLLADTEVLAALDDAVEEVGAAVGTRWQGPLTLPLDREVVVGRWSGRPLIDVTKTGTGIGFKALPLVPGALTVSVHKVDLERGALVRHTDLADPEVMTELEGTEPVDPENLEEGVYEVVARLDDGPRGESELARALAARTFPGEASCGSLPNGLLAALSAELDCRRPDPFELAAGTRLTRLAETVAARALAVRGEHRFGVDPASVWTPFTEHLEERLRLTVGDPFTPKVVVTGTLVRGARMTLAGHLVGRPEAKVILRDQRGSRVPVERVEPDYSFIVPEGLAGALIAEVYLPGGSTEVELGRLAIEVDEVMPPVLDRTRPVRLRGHGFFEGGQVVIGGQTVTLPRSASDEVEVELDPARVGFGEFVIGNAALRVPETFAVTTVPNTHTPGSMTNLGIAGLWVDSPLTVTVRDEPIPVVMKVRGEGASDIEAVLDISALDLGQHELKLESAARVVYQVIAVHGAETAFSRRIEFGATAVPQASTMLREAVEMANGTRPIEGTFRRINMGFQIQGAWHCPLDIEPDTFSFPAPSCPGIYERCDEGWLYDDQRNPERWWRITRPPGRGSTGVRCPVIPGPDSWVGLPIPDVYDTVTSTSPAELTGVTFVGPQARLELGAAKAGGLVVTAPTTGRNDVVLDLVIDDAVGSETSPVVTLNGARGVRIERLEVKGRPGGCRVALRIIDSADIDIEHLSVSGCDTAVEVIRSQRIRIGRAADPAVALGALESFLLREVEDVVLHMRAGTHIVDETSEEVQAVLSGRGVLVDQSARVMIAGSGASLTSDAVLIRNSRGIRVGPFESGLSRNAAGVVVVAGMNNTRGLRVEGDSRDVLIHDTTAVAASSGVDVADTAEVILERVGVGGVADGLGAGPVPEQPLGNFNGGLRIFGGDVVVDGLSASRNGLFGVGVFGGRVHIKGFTTRSQAGDRTYTGAQTCAVEVAAARATVAGFEIVEDSTGFCVREGVIRVADGTIDAQVAAAAEQSRVEVDSVHTSGGVEGEDSVLMLDQVEVVADAAGVEARGGSLGVAGGTVTGDVAVSTRGALTRIDGVVLSGRIGLVVSGTNDVGVPGVVVIGSTLAGNERDVSLADEGLVVLRDSTWATLTSVDRSVDVDGGTAVASGRDVDISGAASLLGSLSGLSRVNAEDHSGLIWLNGGAALQGGEADPENGISLHSVGSGCTDDGSPCSRPSAEQGEAGLRYGNTVYLENQDIREAEVVGARAFVVRSSTVVGDVRCESCAATLVDIAGAGRIELSGGGRHSAAAVTVGGGLRLSRWAQAVLSDTDPVSIDVAMPLGRLTEVGNNTPLATRATLIEGVPDRARVVIGQRTETGVQVLGWVQALGGEARWPGGGELVASVSVRGGGGTWQRVGRPLSCEAVALSATDREVAAELRWQTASGWNNNRPAVEVAACGDRLAEIIAGGTGSPDEVWVDGVVVANVFAASGLAFDADCAGLVWVGTEGTHDVFTTDLATGVITRMTDNDEVELRPRFGPDGSVWFGVEDGSALWVVREGVSAIGLSIGGMTVSSPAPAQSGEVAFIACDAQCRIATLDTLAWSYFDTAALGEDEPCAAKEPRWIERPGEPPLMAYVRDGGQLVLASGNGVVLGALADGVLTVR